MGDLRLRSADRIVSPLLEEFFYKRGYDERATTAITVDEVFQCSDGAAGSDALSCHAQRSEMSTMPEIRDQGSEARDRRTADRTRQDQLSSLNLQPSTLHVSLLTGGSDRHYVLGLVEALASVHVSMDVIGSDELSLPELIRNSRVNFLNLRGDQSPDASYACKIARVLIYYWRLIRYAATAKPKIFHILWNNKFELIDRTLLVLYYKLMGRRVLLTAHNVNIRKRDCTDSWLNRLSLRIQYGLVHHIFVHTERMKSEVVSDFRVAAEKVSVIPYGINNAVPNTAITTAKAKERLGVSCDDKAILCFGQIAPYKGVEYLVTALTNVLKKDGNYRLIIAGKPKWDESYWKEIEQLIIKNEVSERVITRVEHVPDNETEIFFKAADVVVLPYTDIFQSGVLFLAYSFGLPVIAADVGSLRDSIIEGETGFVFEARNSRELASKIELYFTSNIFKDLEMHRGKIKASANTHYSWDKVALITRQVYSKLVRSRGDAQPNGT